MLFLEHKDKELSKRLKTLDYLINLRRYGSDGKKIEIPYTQQGKPVNNPNKEKVKKQQKLAKV